ncbi:MAG: hypothetical protein WAM60_27030, partial [Candidatus Promineifilaceae bacterium]
SSVFFTVDSVTHATNTYQPGSNHDPDGDSDGTVIEVFQDGQPGPTPTPSPSPSPSPTPSPTNTPPPGGGTIHVGDLDGSGVTLSGNRWNAMVTITVHNSSEGPVEGATVSGSWNFGPGGSDTCVTDAAGQCTISRNMRGNVEVVTFTVGNVTLAGNTYNAGANHDPDGDSDGTTIQIAQP